MTEPELLARILARNGIQLTQAVVSVSYKEFVCSLGCVACGSKEYPEPNHLVEKGPQGQNADDFFCACFCHDCHILYHTLTSAGFEKQFNLNLSELWWATLRAYIVLIERKTNMHTEVEIAPKITKSKKKNRLPFLSKCNTPEDFSKYQPKEL